MPNGYLDLFIVSDLHAITEAVSDKGPSYYSTANDSGPNACPMETLKPFITKHSLSADLLICCGDVGDAANPSAIKQSLSDLAELKGALDANDLIITVGNHDLDSRLKSNHYDPRGYLQSMKPEIPNSDIAINDKFWARHFAFISNDDFNLLILNSSAFHGYANELEHGRISKYTMSAIEDELRLIDTDKINIVVMHHHPSVIDDLHKLESYDVVNGGGSLINSLGSGQYGEWLIVHGHRHYPRLNRANGGGSAPYILSAGSLGAITPHNWDVGNYCYHIRYDIQKNKDEGIHAELTSYQWHSGAGWSFPDFNKRRLLPRKCGIGFIGKPKSLLGKIKQLPKKNYKWEEISQQVQEINYLLPIDLNKLYSLLEEDEDCGIDYDRSGYPTRLEIR